MKITLIHGANLEASYQTLTTIKHSLKYKDIRVINAKVVTSLSDQFRLQDLFDESNVYLIESVEFLKESDLVWMRKNAKDFDCLVIIFSNRELTKAFIKKLPPIDKNYKNDIPMYLWKLLDSIYPKNAKSCLSLLRTASLTEPVEKIFALMINQIKDIYIIKLDGGSLNYPSWRLSKLTKAASLFEISDLEDLIHDLAATDTRSKSGGSLYELLSYNLIKHL